MERRQFFALLLAITGMTACASNPVIGGDRVMSSPPYLPVTLSVQSDNRGKLPEFPLNSDSSHYRAYIQATQNDRYRLRVVNNSNQRIGLVIAVDGRNIISGKQSWLANSERMYILNPHDSADYEGWRTGTNQTNRFYFTEAENSYAAAWGDNSAMGVIAMAVYAERPRPQLYNKDEAMSGSASRATVPSTGTGFGESTYSPSMTVSFEPSPEPMEKLFFKYEWRETLCRKGILQECSHDSGNSGNRLWKEDGFAPPPPSR
ncbi:MAG: hypothetical protein WCK96_04835 [Methylococcales bacterium]